MSVSSYRSPANAGAQARTLWDADRQFGAGAWAPAFAGEQCVRFPGTHA